VKVKYVEFVNEKIGTINHRINFILEKIKKRFDIVSVQQNLAISESGVVKITSFTILYKDKSDGL